MALQVRRGTAADVSTNNFVPSVGEPLYVTDEQKLYIGDGTTQKGVSVSGASTLEDLNSVSLVTENVGEISYYSVASNVATITITVGQGYTTGLIVTIAGSSVTALNGTHTITGTPTSTTFTFALTNADVATTATTGSVTPIVPDGHVLKYNAAENYWENGDPSVGIDIVGDTSPQLGGNLDLNNFDIISTAGQDIEFVPGTGGEVIVKGNQDGSGKIKLNCEQNTHGITLKGPPHSAAADYTLILPNDVGTSGQVLSTDGTDTASWITPVTALNDLSDVTAPSPSDGQALIYSSASSAWIPDTAGTLVQHTTFALDSPYTPFTVGAQPTGTVANSTTIGQNNGTWYEMTAANIANTINGPSSSTYDPNLSGISWDAVNNYFTVPQGRYYITGTVQYVLGNYSAQGSTAYPRAYSSVLFAYDGGFNYSYADSDETPRSTFASRDSLETYLKHSMAITAVMESSTTTDNQVVMVGIDDAQPGLYITTAEIRFIRLGDV